MNWIELSKEKPKKDTPLLVTDFKNYCCVEYIPPYTYKHAPFEDFLVLGCLPSEWGDDIDLSFEPTHFAYINKEGV